MCDLREQKVHMKYISSVAEKLLAAKKKFS
jgi:hypothetical protein